MPHPERWKKQVNYCFPKTTQFSLVDSFTAAGTIAIFTFLQSEMGTLVQIATLLSFITAPFYAYLNYKLVNSDQMPQEHKPSRGLSVLSIIGMLFLSVFAVGFLLLAG